MSVVLGESLFWMNDANNVVEVNRNFEVLYGDCLCKILYFSSKRDLT